MSETPTETRDYRGWTPPDGWVTDEARLLSEAVGLLAGISDQLAGLQATADRFELGAAEFLPALRHFVGKRATRAAGAAADLFRRGGHT